MWRFKKRKDAATVAEEQVYLATRDATPDQQKVVMELLLQRKAGAMSDAELTTRVGEVMRRPATN